MERETYMTPALYSYMIAQDTYDYLKKFARDKNLNIGTQHSSFVSPVKVSDNLYCGMIRFAFNITLKYYCFPEKRGILTVGLFRYGTITDCADLGFLKAQYYPLTRDSFCEIIDIIDEKLMGKKKTKPLPIPSVREMRITDGKEEIGTRPKTYTTPGGFNLAKFLQTPIKDYFPRMA